MSDSKQDTSEQSAAIPEASDTTVNKSTPSPTKPKSNAVLWVLTFINFVLIVAIVAAGYWAFLQWNKIEEEKRAHHDRMTQQVISIQNIAEDSAENAKNSQMEVQANLNNLVEQVLGNSQLFESFQSQLADVTGRRPADWLLAEADYLVRMAGRKLWLEDDVKTAMLMLRAADSRIEDLADPSLFPVRKLISEDIQALHQVNPVSAQSVALAISGIMSQVEKLEIAAINIPQKLEDRPDNQLSENRADWRENIAKTWRNIVDDFISVSRVEEPVEPFLSKQQKWLVREQIKYALSQAQSSALNNNETLFKVSMQSAISLLVEYYNLESLEVEQFMKALQQVNSTKIARDYPAQLKSQSALTDIIERRVGQVFTNKDAGEL